MTPVDTAQALKKMRYFPEINELRKRIKKPQRHRLLHGYPLAAAMPKRKADDDFEVQFQPESERGLLIGVLPHPYCNPSVTGCGFCTFPHAKYQSKKAKTVVDHVVREIDQRLVRQPELRERTVAALYFGGGTANLTPPDSFRQLCRKLAESFDLKDAEVTLEGTPIYFLKRQPLLVGILREEIPARHYRISMGIQTFDDAQLKRMGRTAFGNADTFRQVVEMAHERSFTVSGDFLFNLPHQSLNQMQRDLDRAREIGLDHLGLYHLVMFAGLGTPWSRDSELLAGLPSNDVAVENWLALRQMLLESGFHQTTLTNFERNEFANNGRRFLYEELSFEPHRFEMLGFGPGGISFAADENFRSGLKTLNPIDANDYVDTVANNRSAWSRSFFYGTQDLRIFYLTRRLAAMKIDRHEYKSLFGSKPESKFSREIAALRYEGLIEVDESTIQPTPKGIFYADTIAALLAWRKLQAKRTRRRGDVAVRPAQDNVNSSSGVWLPLTILIALLIPFILPILYVLSWLLRSATDGPNDNTVAHM